jgi:hypothetical protein
VRGGGERGRSAPTTFSEFNGAAISRGSAHVIWRVGTNGYMTVWRVGPNGYYDGMVDGVQVQKVAGTSQ